MNDLISREELHNLLIEAINKQYICHHCHGIAPIAHFKQLPNNQFGLFCDACMMEDFVSHYGNEILNEYQRQLYVERYKKTFLIDGCDLIL
jgi:hypothetical protein